MPHADVAGLVHAGQRRRQGSAVRQIHELVGVQEQHPVHPAAQQAVRGKAGEGGLVVARHRDPPRRPPWAAAARGAQQPGAAVHRAMVHQHGIVGEGRDVRQERRQYVGLIADLGDDADAHAATPPLAPPPRRG